jgi:Transposase DDE domain
MSAKDSLHEEQEQGTQYVKRSFEEYRERLRSYGDTESYRKAIGKRQVWVEPLFAEAKEWHGLSRFRLRGLEKVNLEALMIASGQNAKRLVAFGPRRSKKIAMVAALRPPKSPSPHPIRRQRRTPAWRFSTRSPLLSISINRGKWKGRGCLRSPGSLI